MNIQRWRMSLRCGRLLAALLGLALSAAVTSADDLSDFNATVEDAAAHLRVATGYLRTQNGDLATRELERAHDAWDTVVVRFRARPTAFHDRKLYDATLASTKARIATALTMANHGRFDAARDTLASVRASLSALRRANGIELLSDCVLDANVAMDRFFAYHETPPTWKNAAAGTEIAAKANDYGRILKHCDALASAAVKSDPEFRRLLDGAAASLAFVPTAIEQRDGDLLYRVLGELRAFDHLLAFRYG